MTSCTDTTLKIKPVRRPHIFIITPGLPPRILTLRVMSTTCLYTTEENGHIHYYSVLTSPDFVNGDMCISVCNNFGGHYHLIYGYSSVYTDTNCDAWHQFFVVDIIYVVKEAQPE